MTTKRLTLETTFRDERCQGVNLVVDWVKVRTVDWPQSWNDKSPVFHELTDALSRVLCRQERCPA